MAELGRRGLLHVTDPEVSAQHFMALITGGTVSRAEFSAKALETEIDRFARAPGSTLSCTATCRGAGKRLEMRSGYLDSIRPSASACASRVFRAARQLESSMPRAWRR
ncbi:TetR/AcrR family transcriptional regulator C-terminal domain-containing protein [Amycolatopsis cynarae]|uniref:TetR/AcrR family transcriptional regulator C-terminal domain-containing protein n=1 Tax=Amycolatopsis cynarae TaxID=2995223 RepID=A0ABY7B9V2_9PSEU|nr:TetR/AcrR family transcriptional regulator C-terminal domain-containing protein [Amycolatopsis sp. HUAS 11-8]WAL68757.1 TetR/AcrR family transcriptional regulator C-terminal domain-containing protein [Amycolatopsis sp. HUAS 11-8]